MTNSNKFSSIEKKRFEIFNFSLISRDESQRVGLVMLTLGHLQ